MADFTITIANSLRFFGGSPSSKWAEYDWNAFKWGEGTNTTILAVNKAIDNTLGLDSAISEFSNDKMILESLSFDSDMTDEELTDGSGYSYVFPSDVTNAEDRATASYTSGSVAGTSWAAASAGSTPWS